MTPEIPFRRNVVQPVECIKAGWALIKDEYWMFVGICAVGMLLASAVPLGILLGPMMCGIYMTLFKKRRGEFIEFGTLFKGFDFFGPSFVATLIHIVPIIAIVLPAYFIFYVGMILSMATQDPNDPNPAAVLGVFFGFAIFILVMMILVIIVRMSICVVCVAGVMIVIMLLAGQSVVEALLAPEGHDHHPRHIDRG